MQDVASLYFAALTVFLAGAALVAVFLAAAGLAAVDLAASAPKKRTGHDVS